LPIEQRVVGRLRAERVSFSVRRGGRGPRRHELVALAIDEFEPAVSQMLDALVRRPGEGAC
jgi:hypothetical protein